MSNWVIQVVTRWDYFLTSW